jgi:NADPH-dependent glutamate synthase beta subunit-like oxidoreductase
VSEWGTIVADPFDYRTANPQVFAGGDVVRGPATLVEAIGDGQRAAFAIERFLTGRSPRQELLDELGRRRRVPRSPAAELDEAELPRVRPQRVPAQERVKSFVEVVCNITDEQARCEASRCLRCDLEH